MARCRIAIAADRLTAEVHVLPGAPGGRAELQAALDEAGVSFGVDQAMLDEFGPRLRDPEWRGSAVVARGVPPQAGRHGSVEYCFHAAPLPGSEGEDGSIDYRERGLLHPAAAGTVVARLLPPEPGTPGTDVCGRPLPAAPGQAATLQLGPGLRLDEHGSAIATRSGVVVQQRGRLDVVPVFKHDGNVDLHSGNLHTHGSLLIGGDVHAGFKVAADEDVVVRGAVLDGTVTAGGSVVVEQGVLGPASTVIAGCSLHCRHANSARLQAGGPLRASDSLVHCDARGASIEVLQGRGQVVGGALRALGTIRVRRAGTAAGAPTLLAVGDLAAERSEQIRRSAAASRLERRQRKGLGDPGKLRRDQVALVDTVRLDRSDLTQRQRDVLATARIEVIEAIAAGVRIQFGTASMTIQEAGPGARFCWDPQSSTIVQETT